jgi:hypothetical protein
MPRDSLICNMNQGVDKKGPVKRERRQQLFVYVMRWLAYQYFRSKDAQIQSSLPLPGRIFLRWKAACTQRDCDDAAVTTGLHTCQAFFVFWQ